MVEADKFYNLLNDKFRGKVLEWLGLDVVVFQLL